MLQCWEPHLALKAHKRIQKRDGGVVHEAIATPLKLRVRLRAQHNLQVAVLACTGQGA